MNGEVLIAILAKDKGHCFPEYLSSLYNQTYPRNKIHLYIRTNNNKDDTQQKLQNFVRAVGHEYASVYFDNSEVNERVQEYNPHEWNALRFSVLGNIRQKSVEYAMQRGLHYFVADCDNFIRPNTLLELLQSNLPVVGPLLHCYAPDKYMYINCHHCADPNGYFKQCDEYFAIHNRSAVGAIKVDVIHCTYLIRHEVLKHVSYFDETSDYEYIRFSRNLRNSGVDQYILNSEVFGYMTFYDDRRGLEKEWWFKNF